MDDQTASQHFGPSKTLLSLRRYQPLPKIRKVDDLHENDEKQAGYQKQLLQESDLRLGSPKLSNGSHRKQSRSNTEIIEGISGKKLMSVNERNTHNVNGVENPAFVPDIIDRSGERVITVINIPGDNSEETTTNSGSSSNSSQLIVVNETNNPNANGIENPAYVPDTSDRSGETVITIVNISRHTSDEITTHSGTRSSIKPIHENEMNAQNLNGIATPAIEPDTNGISNMTNKTVVTTPGYTPSNITSQSRSGSLEMNIKTQNQSSNMDTFSEDRNKTAPMITIIEINHTTENDINVPLRPGSGNLEEETSEVTITKKDNHEQVELSAEDIRKPQGLEVAISVEDGKYLVPEVYIGPSKRRMVIKQLLNTQSSLDDANEDTNWLIWVENEFKRIAGDDGEISLDEFKSALGLMKSFFAERFFELFDQDGSGSIEMKELMDGLRMLTKGTPEMKLHFLFNVYDADGSGTIDVNELRTVLKSCMEESSLSLTEENLDKLTEALFESADEDGSGTITFEELKAELEKHPGLLENLTISAAQWLKPPEKSKKKKKDAFRYLTLPYIRNNLRKVFFFSWFVLMNMGLFILGAYNYKDSNGFVIAARGAGMCLNFTSMFVLVLMLRKCLTYLRMTIIADFLPLDQNIVFHKMCGLFIAFWTLVHTICHIGNATVLTTSTGIGTGDILFTTAAGTGYVGSSAFITGWLLDIILIVLVICSMPFVRRGGYFQVFYWTHMLYIFFWILLILHGPSFWKWFLGPGVIFVVEKISRSKLIKKARHGNTYIEEVNLLPSKVTHLVIGRPANFNFQPGDYMLLQIPAIAAHEWHPFTISSAPEMKQHIWLHVRSAGHWTNKLYAYFHSIERKQVSHDSSEDKKSTKKEGNKLTKPVKCYFDGPYGTGCREVFDTEHAVLIGAGIGVTPMASILQSVWYKYMELKQKCPKCQHSWHGQVPESMMKLNKVDFIWINRDQRSFEWFISLLAKLEMEQCEDEPSSFDHVIEMHMFMTAAAKKTDMKGIGLQMALELMHKKENKDLITGLKTKTEAGRPDWNKIFTKIRDEKKGKVKVFYCGAPALGKTIKDTCAKFNFSFCKENF
ncbi:hypothetical protein ACJMK2_024696 [Sinanodonta woodiana]|uniref:NADPH oxidase 5 n=1 Tax=Sinanodonta woodiana TaxID=1069815 RepID=A0ABD3XI19_SINWO